MTVAYSSPVWKMIDKMRLDGYDVRLEFDRIGHGRSGLVSCAVYVQSDDGIIKEHFIEKIERTVYSAVSAAYAAWQEERNAT